MTTNTIEQHETLPDLLPGRLVHACRTCGQDFATFQQFVDHSAACPCPAIVTYRTDIRHAPDGV